MSFRNEDRSFLPGSFFSRSSQTSVEERLMTLGYYTCTFMLVEMVRKYELSDYKMPLTFFFQKIRGRIFYCFKDSLLLLDLPPNLAKLVAANFFLKLEVELKDTTLEDMLFNTMENNNLENHVFVEILNKK